MWLFASAAGDDTVELVTRVGLTLFEKGGLVAFSVVCLTLAIGALYVAYKISEKIILIQDKRVQDQKDMNARMELLTEKMITAFSDMKAALDKLTVSDQKGQEVLQQVKDAQLTLIQVALGVKGPRGK